MKDLTNYFTSPTKAAKATETPNKNVFGKVNGVLNESKDSDVKVLNNSEQSTKNKPNGGKKKKKKVKRREPSDPAVKSITELLSNSLSIISPNTSVNISASENAFIISSQKSEISDPKKSTQNEEKNYISEDSSFEEKPKSKKRISKSMEKSDKNLKKSDNKPQKDNLPKENPDINVKTDTKDVKNAFQFLMDSRNKVIGQNSLGIELLIEENKLETEIKSKLSARKNLLENWAEKKGAAKRKREEREKDLCIDYKLKRRAKRLKRMLQVNLTTDDEDSNLKEIPERKNKVKRIISSDSECSNDSFKSKRKTEKSVNVTEEIVIEENAQDILISKATKSTTKSKETKQNLLNFYGVINNAEKSELNIDTVEIEKHENTREIIKVKMFTPKTKKKSRLSLNKKSPVNKIKVEKTGEEELNIVEDSTSEIKIENPEIKNVKEKLRTPSKRKSKKIIVIDDSTLESNEELDLKKDKANTKEVFKSTGKEPKTPRSLKSWKMKIKVNSDTEETKSEEEEPNKRVLRDKKSTQTKNSSLFDNSSNESLSTLTKRNKKENKKYDESPEKIVLLSSDEETSNKKKNKKTLKVAPVFAKAAPKPKIDPKILKARKQFLMSGIPSSLKRTIEKQKSLEEKEFDIFPTISHVQQKNEENHFWHLPKPDLEVTLTSPLKIDKLTLIMDHLTKSHIANNLKLNTNMEAVKNIPGTVKQIKSDNPDYPVYKSFKLIFEKSTKNEAEKPKKELPQKNKKSRKQRRKSVEIVETSLPKSEFEINFAMWTEKYKPKSSKDILGNQKTINSLKEWLEIWKNFSDEINMRKKRQRENSTSESEFETTDCDSRDSTRLPGNTLVLGGPSGSGKSTAVYAVCNELGFKVLELNASSKRTGKLLLQELQEATQSHQVHKHELNSVANFFSKNLPKEVPEEPQKQKMCVLLVEDVDLVFEQDDGFITALTQLVNTSKRPIILTTTNDSSVFVQKFISQYEFLTFLPLSAHTLAVWLQLVCLVEGLLVNKDDIGYLLEYNKGDVRKTLLELQFWVKSGGQFIRDGSLPLKSTPTSLESQSIEEFRVTDDDSNLSYIDKECAKDNEEFIHKNCIASFEIFGENNTYNVPLYLNLGTLWWNFGNILGEPNMSYERLNRFSSRTKDEQIYRNTTKNNSLTNKLKLAALKNLYDSLILTDINFRKVGLLHSNEPIVNNWSCNVKDGLELTEMMSEFNSNKDLVHDLTHTLVNGCIDDYKSIDNKECCLNLAVPVAEERRWRATQHVCEDFFKEILPVSGSTERKSVALDYLPALRNIARSEDVRAHNNTKRGNRFRHYFKDFNLNFSDSTCKLACNILLVREECS